MPSIQINFRIAEEAAAQLYVARIRDKREIGDMVRLALMEYMENHHPDLAPEFIAHTLAGGSVEKYEEALESVRERIDREKP